MVNLDDLEEQVVRSFQTPNLKTPMKKVFFNYLLMNPLVLDRMKNETSGVWQAHVHDTTTNSIVDQISVGQPYFHIIDL